MTQTIEKTVREIAAECPASVRVFEQLGIDYCCGGKKSLQEACAAAQVPLDQAVGLLQEAERGTPGPAPDSWLAAPLDALTAHIVQKHHAYVRQEIPRLQALLHKVVSKHAAVHPELSGIQQQFELLAQELTPHMMKEEYVLFPYIEQLVEARLSDGPLPGSCFGTVRRPIAAMAAEHDGAGDLLRELRRLSNHYAIPAGVCPTFAAVYRGLEEFEADLHQHIHLENNILFPRAIELEQEA